MRAKLIGAESRETTVILTLEVKRVDAFSPGTVKIWSIWDVAPEPYICPFCQEIDCDCQTMKEVSDE